MKYVDEYRDPQLIRQVADEIRRLADPGRHYRIMEVCGGHTHAIYRFGLADVLPENIELIHGPGCPVCVLPMGRTDDGLAVAEQGAIFTAFGDVMRVPGTHGSPLEYKARGTAIRMVYSPLDALKLARANPRPARDVLRHRFRDHRPFDRPDAPAGEGGGDRQLLRPLEPRHDHPGDPGDPRVAGHAARRLRRSGARVDRHRLPPLRIHRAQLRQAGRGLGLRAARHPAVDPDDPASARGGEGGGREPVRARRPLGGEPRGAQGAGRSLRAAPLLRVARARLHLAVGA